jgi:hypothetical protein
VDAGAMMRGRLFVIFFCAFVALAPREPWSGRTRAFSTAARHLVGARTLDLADDAPSRFTSVAHGQRRLVEPVGALLLAPAALAYRAGERVGPLVEAASAAALAALVCVVFFANLRRLGVAPRAALGGTLLVGFATSLWVYARLPDGTAAAALALLLALDRARRLRAAPNARDAIALGLAGGALALIAPELGPAALVLGVLALAGTRGRSRLAGLSLAALGPLVLASVLVEAYRIAIGAPPAPRGDLLEGLYGLLLSTGKSVFLYNPPLALGVLALPWFWRTRRSEALLTLAVLAGGVLSIARLVDWHGDPAWGPRRLVPLVPIAMEPIAAWLAASWAGARRRTRALVAALAVGGAGVQLLGAALPADTFLRVATLEKDHSGAPGWFGEAPSECHFIPQLSPLVGNAWLLAHAARHDRNLAADPPWTLIVPSTPRLDAEWPHLRVDWWAAGWPRLPAALGLLALAVALLAAAAGVRCNVLR